MLVGLNVVVHKKPKTKLLLQVTKFPEEWCEKEFLPVSVLTLIVGRAASAGQLSSLGPLPSSDRGPCQKPASPSKQLRL
jgi:hypothetical protein